MSDCAQVKQTIAYKADEAVKRNLFWSVETSWTKLNNSTDIMVGKLGHWLYWNCFFVSKCCFHYFTNNISSFVSPSGRLASYLSDVINNVTHWVCHASIDFKSERSNPPLHMVLLKLLLNRIAFKVYKLRQNWLIWVLNIL